MNKGEHVVARSTSVVSFGQHGQHVHDDFHGASYCEGHVHQLPRPRARPDDPALLLPLPRSRPLLST
jgi:hypothetical protein